MLNFTPPSTPILSKLLDRIQDLTPAIADISADHVKALQDNIINEGGDPDTGAAWKILSSAYVEQKRLIGAFLTILRRTDDMRQGITVIEKDGRSYQISVTGKAKTYFASANEKRKFLGMSGDTKRQAKLRLSKHFKS